MIPAQFDYEAPKSLDEALMLLAQDPDSTKILAGGHSLIPAMKLRLAQPQLVVDIARIKDLSYIREDDDRILIGAATTHYQIESHEGLKRTCPLLPACAGSIGDVQVRNKGTIGGSLAHSDPAADWPAATLALRSQFVLRGPNGERTVQAREFFVDMLTTALQPGEILREIQISKPTGKFGQAYHKVRHPASGFAVVGVAVALSLAANGLCESIGIGVTGVGAKAYIPSATENSLKGKQLSPQVIADAAAQVSDGIEANTDLAASADYRCHLAVVHAQRAIQDAFDRARS